MAPSCNASPQSPPSAPQRSSYDTTYKDTVSYFTLLQNKPPDLKVKSLVEIANKVLGNRDDLAKFQKLYDPGQGGCLKKFWNLCQPSEIDSHTLALRVLCLLDTDEKVRHKILKCILSRLIDKEEKKPRQNGLSNGDKYRTLARATIGKEWSKKLKGHDLAGQKWRMLEIECLIGFGGLGISRLFERLHERDIYALISWLRLLPQYKEWTALSSLATKLEDAFYNPQAQADLGLHSPCLSSCEAVLPPSPSTSNGIS
ncbi:hypothetical protein ACEQ8H_001751 [Pleosporales sp. CAS-2024a]